MYVVMMSLFCISTMMTNKMNISSFASMELDLDMLDIDEDEQLAQSIDLFSPMYSKQQHDCLLCTYQYLSEYEPQISKFESMLTAANSKLGCGVQTCITIVLKEIENDDSMQLFRQLSEHDICQHFDSVFGHPLCGYNRLKQYNFFSLFDENTVENASYVKFIYHTYKHSRTTSLCPYALLCVYVYLLMISTIGEVTEYKKKHDFLWMYNSLCNHKMRLGKLK